MEKKKIITLILFILFVICGCTKTDTESLNGPAETDELFFLEGIVIEPVDNKVVSGIEVHLKSDIELKDTTDENGKFSFNNLVGNEYSLLIDEYIYAKLDSTITIQSNLSISIKIARIFNDYFPLGINNSWTYKYTELYKSNNYCAGMSKKLNEGTRTWKIIRIESDSIYYFSEKTDQFQLDAEFDFYNCLFTYDTVSFQSTETEFILIEFKTHQLKSAEPLDMFHNFVQPVFRYQSIDSPESMAFKGYIKRSDGDYNWESCNLEKDVGLKNYEHVLGSSAHHYFYKTYELIETNVN